MTTWSTAHLPPRDRFEYWREERARHLFGVEGEISAERRLAFTGRMTLTALGAASLVEVEVTPYTMRRTQRAIDRTPDDNFYIRQCLRGGGLTTVGGETTRIRGGALSTGSSDRPYTNEPDPRWAERNILVLYRAIRIPFALIQGMTETRAKAEDGLVVCQHPDALGLNALLRGYLATFVEQTPHLAGADAEQAVRTLAQLAITARGLEDPRSDQASAAIRAGLLERARGLIERDLHRSDLDPARIASALGISVRKLHLVFEPTGESVSRYVLARRVARADRLLIRSPDLSIVEVAYASGFDGLSTFYRCYRAAFGASPGERRSVALQATAAEDRGGPTRRATPASCV